MNKYKTNQSFYTKIPVYGGGQPLTWLRRLAEIELNLVQGQFVQIIGRCIGTTEDVAARGKNVNWVLSLRIEPTAGNNWGLNVGSEGRDNYAAPGNGQVGFRFNGNITPDMHHESREISDSWEVTSTGVWYAKLCSRAATTGALPDDELDIDLVELEVLVYD